ncbi:MAG: hypothetical protein M1816_003501 [Peltula sp. TS41687]|nr:MAG: hypothetical protein M1816_003501 [Peltula sp. TS41687]
MSSLPTDKFNAMEQAAAIAAAAQSETPDLPRIQAPQQTASDGPRALAAGTPRHEDGHTSSVDADLPPPYSQDYHEFQLNEGDLDTKANIAHDGRVNIRINQRSRSLSNLLTPALYERLGAEADDAHQPSSQPPEYIPPSLTGKPGEAPPPPMNIVVFIVGSRGDVQPFVALGQVLKNKYGHRVRLATHLTFRPLVEENGLEFFNIGGDPAELMAFMVKNPGLMPGFETLRSGDVGKRRKGISEIINGCWRACIEPGDGTGASPIDYGTDDGASVDSGISLGAADQNVRPFIADVIISNPASFAHVHCAEKLGIPLHLVFTMPWSPTRAFPHPLANIQSSNADTSMTNFMSYALVEMMTWQGLGDVINRFRERTLRLEPVSVMWAPGMLSRLRIPWTYCWSPALIPKPRDWGSHIDISGFFFLSLASSYVPDPDLMTFLNAGPPPVYIGFGSIVVDDPNALTRLIFEAVRKAGVRALVSKGWGGLGTDELGIPEGVFMLGNVPHDWLFKHVSAVVHHGGAGTTAAGVALGKPTVIVPFFGDQPFWGSMIARAGAGPEPIPHKSLTADSLAMALLEALKPSAQQKAAELGAKIGKELGAESGAKSFHDRLNVDSLRCNLLPNRVAVWRVKRTKVRLSALAAAVLGQEGLLDFHDLKLYRPREYDTDGGPWDPISGGASALIGTIGNMMMGFADFPVEVIRGLTRPQDNTPEGCERKSSSSFTRVPTGATSAASSQSTIINDPQSGTPRESTESSDGAFFDTPGTSSPQSSSAAATPHPEGTVRPQISNTPERRHQSDASVSTVTNQTFDGRHKRSIAQAFSGHLSRSRSRERPSSPGGSHFHRTHSDHAIYQNTINTTIEAGQSVGRIVEAGLKSPLDFTLALARGFHNAPKLYGDKTVREIDRVTGFQSGLKAAGKEFGYGFYDGISGVVTQPIQGAKEEGAAGFVKGIARGLGGMILKPGAAIWGLPGYTFKGVYKEVQKLFGPSIGNYIIAARTAQGYEDLQSCTQTERADIIKRWQSLQDEIRKAKQTFVEETRKTVTEYKLKKQHTMEDQKKRRKEKREHRSSHQKTDDRPHLRSHSQSSHSILPRLLHSHSFPGAPPPPKDAKHPELEEAIQTSVAATSKGDAEQDELIERAIRASVNELVTAQHEQVEEHEALHRTIQASLSESRRAGEKEEKENSHTMGTTTNDDEDDEALREALYRSLQEYRSQGRENHEQHGVSQQNDDEDDLQKAVEESKLMHSRQEEADARARAEEDILLEHVKRQSLEEEEKASAFR